MKQQLYFFTLESGHFEAIKLGIKTFIYLSNADKITCGDDVYFFEVDKQGKTTGNYVYCAITHVSKRQNPFHPNCVGVCIEYL